MEVKLRADRGDWLPRVAGKTRKQEIFYMMEPMKSLMAKPKWTEKARQSYEEQIRIMTLAGESC